MSSQGYLVCADCRLQSIYPSKHHPSTSFFPTPQVVLPLMANLCLDLGIAQRIGALYSPRFIQNEVLFFVLSALFEVLDVALLAPPLLLGRIAMCRNWEARLARAGLLGGGGGAGEGADGQGGVTDEGGGQKGGDRGGGGADAGGVVVAMNGSGDT